MKFINFFSIFVGQFCPPESRARLRIRILIHNTLILPFTFIQIFGERLLEKFLCLHIDSGESRLYSRYSTGSFYFPH